MKNLKEKLKDLIFSFDYIPKKEKEEWFLLIENLNTKKLQEVYENLRAMEEQEKDFMIETLIKHGLGEELVEQNEEILRKFKRETMKKRERYSAKEEESPEDVLKKLNDL